jgi:hypothetical protein
MQRNIDKILLCVTTLNIKDIMCKIDTRKHMSRVIIIH